MYTIPRRQAGSGENIELIRAFHFSVERPIGFVMFIILIILIILTEFSLTLFSKTIRDTDFKLAPRIDHHEE